MIGSICERPGCVNTISEYTKAGNKKPAKRLAEQKYCSPSCSRLCYVFERTERKKITPKQLSDMDNFLRGTHLTKQITSRVSKT